MLECHLQLLEAKPTKPNLTNPTYQTKPTKPNLQNQIYQTFQTIPNIRNQNFQRKKIKVSKLDSSNPMIIIKTGQVQACSELGTAQPQLV